MMIKYEEEGGIFRCAYLNSLNLIYGLDRINEQIVATCSCCGVYDATHVETAKDAETWLEIKFNEYKKNITEDGKYFIYPTKENDIIVGEIATGMNVSMTKELVVALYEAYK